MRNSMKLPDKLKVDVDLWRKLGFWIKIPCISGAGSWYVSDISFAKYVVRYKVEIVLSSKLISVGDLALIMPSKEFEFVSGMSKKFWGTVIVFSIVERHFIDSYKINGFSTR